MLIFTQRKPSGSWPGLAAVLYLLLFLPASSSQAEKELTDSPATSKRISFPGSSESPLSSKRPKTSEETKPEQVSSEGALLGGAFQRPVGSQSRAGGLGAGTVLAGTADSAGGGRVPHRCTSVPIASTATPMSTGCGCTP